MHRLKTVAVSSYLIDELDRLIKEDNLFKNRTEALNEILDEYLKTYKMAKVAEADRKALDKIGG